MSCWRPNIGSYVGGDITAGAFTSLIWNTGRTMPCLSTWGRMVSWSSAIADFLMSCACTAGPAFEGGDISCGMRATDGAVEALHASSAQTHGAARCRIVGPMPGSGR